LQRVFSDSFKIGIITMPAIPSIVIGKYALRTFINHKGEEALWLSEGGIEGVETSIKELEEVIAKFYKEKF